MNKRVTYKKRSKKRSTRGGQLANMKISYPSYVLNTKNTVITKEETSTIPKIQLPPLKLSTLIMHDPDSMNPSWLHFLVINIPNGDISKGDVIVSYAGPTPPPNTGTHRYIFELYEQARPIVLESLNRSGFSMSNFTQKNELKFVKKQMFKVNS